MTDDKTIKVLYLLIDLHKPLNPLRQIELIETKLNTAFR